MLTQSQISELRDKLLDMKKEYEQQLLVDNSYKARAEREEDTGELSKIDNHPGDEATEVFEREKDVALNNLSREKLNEIDEALQAMEDGTYGICEIGEEEISLERLRAVPETKRCIKHADNEIESKRPVEEDVIHPVVYEQKDEEVVFDRESSWEAVHAHGGSESPSDVPHEDKPYGGEGDSMDDFGAPENVENKPVSDIEGKDTGKNSEQKERNDGSRNR